MRTTPRRPYKGLNGHALILPAGVLNKQRGSIMMHGEGERCVYRVFLYSWAIRRDENNRRSKRKQVIVFVTERCEVR